MRTSDFEAKAPGQLLPIEGGAVAYIPSPLPPELDRTALFDVYGMAMGALGELNAKIVQLGNPNLIIRPLQRREALTSSAMEGTYTTSDDLALLEAGSDVGLKGDTREVLNYVEALTEAVDAMVSLPLCHRLIKDTHARLLSGLPHGRGGNKRPGEYKVEQNWIGGLTPSSARFVPPPPREAHRAMDQLEAFLNRGIPTDVPPLIEAALVHYQFETIHPFADGNGRVGRILIPLVLLNREAINSPVFYPSASMEGRKDEYIDRMFAVSAKGEWTGWIRFFLEICQDTCRNSVRIIDRLIELQADYRKRAMSSYRSNNVVLVVDRLFLNPVISMPIVRDLLGVTPRAARQTIAHLETIGILEPVPGTSMPEYFVAREILRASA